MREVTVHRVDGVGRQLTGDSSQPLDPRVFEQAIHGLQEVVLKVGRFESGHPEDDYEPDYERTEEEGQPVLELPPDTTLHTICKQVIPRRWDASIVIDQVRENSYGVRGSVNCGGGVTVRATILVSEGQIRRLDVAHNSISDPDEVEEVTSLSTQTSSRELAHLNRWLERSVTAAYAKTIPSAATAFDFTATKEDIPALGSRAAPRRNRRESLAQKEWAAIRDKTPQTVSDNVRAAREQLRDLPENEAFDRRGAALKQLTEDADYKEGDIRLV